MVSFHCVFFRRVLRRERRLGEKDGWGEWKGKFNIEEDRIVSDSRTIMMSILYHLLYGSSRLACLLQLDNSTSSLKNMNLAQMISLPTLEDTL